MGAWDWRVSIAALVLGSVIAVPCTALARDILDNPFAPAAAYAAERGEAAHATFRARYEATTSDEGAYVLTIDASDDWALVTRGPRVRLFDFKLGRVFELFPDGATFSSGNQMAEIVFRVLERQNRSMLNRILQTANNRADMPDGCDAETELGVVIPTAEDVGRAEARARGNRVEAVCNGRVIGSIELGDGARPPAAFWPAMASVTTAHPILQARAMQSQHAPHSIDTSFRNAAVFHRAWRLTSVETIDKPYPLVGQTNVTAQDLDQIGPGLAPLASDAVAGHAQGGAPTLVTWGHQLEGMSAPDAALLLGITANMFPAVLNSCSTNGATPICSMIGNLRQTATAEPAVRAFFEMSAAEQHQDFARAEAQMRTLHQTRYADHPAVGASFALVLDEGGDAIRTQAHADNLPTDPRALQLAALQAYPYDPAFWTDIGDQYMRDFDIGKAYLVYEVSYSLPVPGARGDLVQQRMALAQQIKTDFPAFFLPR